MRIFSRRTWLVGGALAALTLVSACAYDAGRSAGYSHVRAGNWGDSGGYGAPSAAR